jgi:hypothetical protein
MFSGSYQVSPLGFRSPIGNGEKGVTEPDVQIVNLYQQYRTGRRSLLSFEYRDEIISCVRRLFGYLPEWLDAQDKNTRISEQSYELLKDTIAFLNTGVRPVALFSRLSIIGTEISMNTYQNPSASGRTTRLLDELKVDPVSFIHRWITVSPDGLYDMLCTTHFLFGLNPNGDNR